MNLNSVTFSKYAIKDTSVYGMPYSSGRIFDQKLPHNHIDYRLKDNTIFIIDDLYAEDKATLYCLLGVAIRFGQNNGIRRIEIEKSLDDNVIDTLTALGFTEKDNNSVRKRLFVFDIPESEYFVIR